jgi:pimeloyl-ACP methyl ester carboxylesterase
MATMTLTGLEIAYTDTGPRNGPAVLLLHGWPDDASTWEAIVPVLTGAGLRVIVPTLRGFGESRFRRATRRDRVNGRAGHHPVPGRGP